MFSLHCSSMLFNLLLPVKCLPTSPHDMDSFAPPSFYYAELKRALAEQSFGLARFDVLKSSSPHEATAFVTLLEGTAIRVSLTTRGYQLDVGDGCDYSKRGQIFESIEGLLQSVSNMYDRRRRDVLFSKLANLS